MLDVAKSEKFRNFTVLNKALFFFIKLDKTAVHSVAMILIVISFYSRSCLGQDTAKESLVFKPSCHLPAYHPWFPHRPFYLLNVKQEWYEITIFRVFGGTRPGIEPTSTVLVADASSTQPLINSSVAQQAQ